MLLYRIVIAVRREEQGTLGRPIWLYYRYLASHLGLAGLPVRTNASIATAVLHPGHAQKISLGQRQVPG